MAGEEINKTTEGGKVRKNEVEQKPKRSLFRKIINTFIGVFAFLIFLVVVLVGFSQTLTFREMLREKVIELVNSETNGRLSIERLDGTILTSLFLRNTSIIVDGDTLLSAKKIEIKTSPLQLLLKKIYFRKVVLEDASVSLLQDKEGKWNYERLLKPTEEDTSKSAFDFFVQANDIQLKNLFFRMQAYENAGSNKFYNTINFDDLSVSKLFLSAEAFLDFEKSNFLLRLKEFSFKPNLSRFTLQNISGDFVITDSYASVSNFALITDSSDIRLNARLDSVNLFGKIELEDFKNYPVSIDLDVASFNFDDLSSFIGSTELLKGNPSLELKAKGKFGAFNIEKLALDYRSTHFEIGGQVLNLNKPEKLFIKTHIKDTDINYRDVNALLPSLELPEFAKLSVSGVNIDYEGEPTNFKAKFAGMIENGRLEFDCALNLQKEPMVYAVSFETNELDLNPVIGLTTLLNSKGTLTGKGVSPMELESEFKFTSENSVFNGIQIDYVNLFSKAKNRAIDITVEGKSNQFEPFLTGSIQYDADTIPSYSFVGSLKHFNLEPILKDEEYKTDLNFYFSAEGKEFDLDRLTGNFSIGIDSSKYRETEINYSSIDLNFMQQAGKRSINLVSDFVDFSINGSFSLNEAFKIVLYEAKTISEVVAKKLDELNPLSVANYQMTEERQELKPPEIINNSLKFDFDFRFKDFQLIAEIIGYERLDIVGNGKGSVTNNPPNFTINTEVDLDYLIFMEKESTLYISEVQGNLNFSRDNRYRSFDNLFGSASLTGKRFYSGSNIKNIAADVTFNESKIVFNLSAELEDLMKAETDGTILITPIEQQVILDNINIDYRGVELTNREQIKIFFNPYRFKVANCVLYNDTSSVSLNGIIESNGDQNILVKAERLSGEIISKILFNVEDPKFVAGGNARLSIGGSFDDPRLFATVNLHSLSYDKFNLGSLEGMLDYSEKKITTSFNFIDSKNNREKPLLTFSGTIPIDLSFGRVKERLIGNEEMNLKLVSNNFNLKALGNLLPYITEQRGDMTSEISLSGTLESPKYSGFLTLRNGYFISRNNNLPYSFGLKMNMKGKEISIDSVVVANAGSTKFPGQLTGSGNIILKGTELEDFILKCHGEIAVLGEVSRSVSPLLYGDLQLGSGNEWLISLRGNRLFFKGDVLLKETNLTFITREETGSVSNTNFDFIYLVDSSKIDKEQQLYEEVLAQENKNQSNGTEEPAGYNLDYEVNIKVDNYARMTFILSQALNQKLYVEMRGDLKYESYGGEVRAQGAFNLMPGSKLEFFKTFDATGLLRFESEVTNPYLDIVSTYTSDYIDPRDPDQIPQEVAVKIRIKGPLSELGKNLANNPESIGVYVGARDIQNNVRDARYDYADAFSFIFMGKFKDDLTAQDRAQVAGTTSAIGNTATSFLGSVLTNFVNSAVGDLVNNIQISQTGEFTKFSLSGRYQNLRYSFGGTTEVFQNLQKANFKFEYLFNPKFSVRLERKDPIVTPYGLEEKINEMALKYRFEF